MIQEKSVVLPEGFLLGVATAYHQYQIWGECQECDWAEWENSFERKRGLLNRGLNPIDFSSKIHVNSCRELDFRKDAEMARELGINVFRISAEWSLGREGLKRLRRDINFLRDLDFEVVLSARHFTLPKEIAARGGWFSRRTIKEWLSFVDMLLDECGNSLSYLLTGNEDTLQAEMAHRKGIWPPGEKSLIRALLARHNMTEAHRRTYETVRKYDSVGRIKIGTAYNVTAMEPLRVHSSTDRMTIKIRRIFRDTVFLKSIAPYLDFWGLNYYFGERVGFTLKPPFFRVIPWSKERDDRNNSLAPEGIREAIHFLYSLRKIPIMVTECGVADRKGVIAPEYFVRSFLSVLAAIRDGIPVLGYLWWTLIDGPEWEEGWNQKYGIFELDRNLRRNPRPIANLLQEVASSRKIYVRYRYLSGG